jgi:hypothetical protein
MPENPAADSPAVLEIRTRLQKIAQMLRQGGSLDAGSQRALAELVDEMTSILETEKLPDAELAHLTQTTAQMEEAIRHQQDLGVVGTVRTGLERAAANTEANAPIAVGFSRKLLDALANIGI